MASPADTVKVAKGRDVLEIPADRVEDAATRGYRPVSAERAQAIAVTKEASEQGGRAAVEAVGRGLFFGLTDLAAARLGADTEALAARAEGTQALEFAGAIAPVLLSGGAGAVGLGARAGAAGARAGVRGALAAAPTALVSRTTAGVGEAVASRLGGGVLARAAGHGVGAGLEGMAYGAGAVVSEASLGDADITAEKLLAGAGEAGIMSALLGGGVSLAGSGLAAAARGGRRIAGSAFERVAGAGDDLADPAVRAAALGDGPGARLAHAEARALGADATQHASIDALANASRTEGGRQILAAASRPVADSLGEIGLRMRSVVGTRTDDAFEAAQRELASTAKIGTRGAGEALQLVSARIDDAIKNPAGWGFSDPLSAGALRQARKILRASDDDLIASPAKAHATLHRAANDLDDLISQHRAVGSRDAAQLEGFRDALRGMVDDGAMWGPRGRGMLDVYAARKAESAALDKLPNRVKLAMENGVTDSNATLVARYGEQIGEVLAARRVTADALENVGQDVKALRQAIDEADGGVVYGREVAAMREHRGNVGRLEEGARARLARGGASTIAQSVGGVAGGLVGWAAGKGVGAALGAFTRPMTTLRVAARVRQMLESFDGAEKAAFSAARGFVEGAKVAAKGVGAAARTAAAKGAGSLYAAKTPEAKRSRERQIEALRDMVVQLAGDPMAIGERLESEVFDLRHVAPAAADLIPKIGAKATMFLMSKLPPVHTPKFGGGKPLVDPAQLTKFGSYAEALADPLSKLAALATGGLQTEHVEAIAACYPKLFERFTAQIMEAVGMAKKNGRPVPYQARVRVGSLFGIPLDDSLEPGFAASINGGPPPPAEMPPPGTTVRGTLSKAPIERDSSRTTIEHLEKGGVR